jgi:hypothetical protein
MLNVVVLSVIMLKVVVLNVVMNFVIMSVMGHKKALRKSREKGQNLKIS